MVLAGAKFVITGGNRGIGWSVAQMAARAGARVYVVARALKPDDQAELTRLGAASVHFLKADLSTRESTEDLARRLVEARPDILFNNAGLLTGGLLDEQPLDEIYAMLQVNLNALIHLTRAVIPGMVERRRGRIINNASVSAFMHFPCASTYAAAKAAVVAFTDCIELELRGTGVSTLCLITPGIKTRMFGEIETKYAKNFVVPQETWTPEEYARQIKAAIENDQRYLWPGGSTAMGLFVARHLPPLFRKAVSKKFHR